MKAEELWQASLGGHTCKAFAWIQSTSIDILDGKGKLCRVPGVRRWRGRALIDRSALPQDLTTPKALRYSGKVIDGNEERVISADVDLHFSSDDVREMRAHGREQYVEFVGAETPFKAEYK
jgi:hypothetical protein